MLHLGLFAVLARGLKKATILLTSVLSLPAAADLRALTADVQGFLVVEAIKTISNTTTSSFSMPPEGEGSVIGDWNGGKEGWVKSALVESADIVGLVTVKVMSGMIFGWSKDLLPGGTNFFWLPSPSRINLEEPISSGYPAHLGLICFSNRHSVHR
jgi:hypothetical protein